MSKKKYYDSEFINTEIEAVDEIIETFVDDIVVEQTNEVFYDESVETVSVANEKACKIIKAISNSTAIIDYDGYGIVVSGSLEGKSNVTVRYEGTIGKPDFKIEVVK